MREIFTHNARECRSRGGAAPQNPNESAALLGGMALAHSEGDARERQKPEPSGKGHYMHMTELTKAKLLLAKATDTAIDAAEKAVVALAADFIKAKPKLAASWDQATHARFIGYCLGLDAPLPPAAPEGKEPKLDVPAALADSEFGSLDNVERAVFLLRAGNASQFRQILVKAGHLAKAEDLGDYS